LDSTALSEKNIVEFCDSGDKKYRYSILDKKIEKFNPNDVESGMVDTILISAYAAQDLIKKIIERYNVKCNVITLY
jgi:hypothetical protein